MYGEWKDIPGYEKLYQANKYGQIRGIQRYKNGRILVEHKNSSGYSRVCLFKNGKRYKPLVHKLIAITFIPNPENKPVINHKDGNKQNNCVDNLEWTTQSENVKHSYANGLQKPSDKQKYAVRKASYYRWHGTML